jgi:hypothetical protein
MMTRRAASAGLASSALLTVTPSLAAAGSTMVELPPPRTEGGEPLIQTLKLRQSIREYSDQPLPVSLPKTISGRIDGEGRLGSD